MDDASEESGFPSELQRELLNRDERVVLVEAGPGSGKTELFIEETVQSITHSNEGEGVLALSFSNSAKEIIEKRLSKRDVSYNFPHFIGTIDSFIYNFIVRPFAPDIFHSSGMTLISGDLEEVIDGPEVHYKKDREANIYRVHFYREHDSHPQFEVKDTYGESNIIQETFWNKQLYNAKVEHWKETGNVTHSDCRYIASRILEQRDKVLRILKTRFSDVLVDELQDIGFYQARTIKRIIENDTNAFLVGDSDQSIYRFHGATGQIFDQYSDIQGCVTQSLNETYRFGQGLCEVSAFFQNSSNMIEPAPDNHRVTSIRLCKFGFGYIERAIVLL